MYRASFPETFKEANNAPSHSMHIVLGISVSIVIAYFLSNFLRNTGGCGLITNTLNYSCMCRSWQLYECNDVHVVLVVRHVCDISFPIVGPTLPHTYKNEQWEADTRLKLLRQKANPIEGISSRV